VAVVDEIEVLRCVGEL